MYQQQPWMQQGTPTGQQAPQHSYQAPQQQQYMPGTPMPPPPGFTQQAPPFTQPTEPGRLPLEQSYIENILRLNRGKVGTFYMTFENNPEWNAKIFRGVVDEAGRDHIIISDPQSGKYYLLLMINLDYVTFDEPLEYEFSFNGAPLIAYPPR
ncbi:spore coat protein GerQ [Bacillaceae bacterium IKA-2]|nr:spore coat protein GerQ [Bacillaceae bacterium IKA-2]